MILDITISDSALVWFCIIIIGLIIIAWSQFNNIIEAKHKSNLKTSETKAQIEKLNAETELTGEKIAKLYFETWKQEHLEELHKNLENAATLTAQARLGIWINENEERIRKDAAHRSLKVNLGKVTEHLLPFSEQFKNFNPKDARFIGSPIDLIVFDGVCDKKDLITIYFIEVKTGGSALSKPQMQIRNAIDNHRVKWLRMSTKDEDLNLELG